MTILKAGHAPGDLRDAFHDLVEQSPTHVEFRGEQVRARRLCGLLWNCTDILPRWIGDELDIPQAATYAVAAREVARCIDRRAESSA